MLEQTGLVAAVAAVVSAFSWGAVTVVACAFGEPPPTPRQMTRAFIDWGLGVFLALQVGYAAGPAAAGFVNQLVQKFVGVAPGLGVEAGGLIVGALVLRGGTKALDWVEAFGERKRADLAAGGR